MNTSTSASTSASAVSADELKAIMQKIEKDAENKVLQGRRNRALGNGPRIIDDINNIMSDGAKEFEEKVGRPMTYSEMRSMFG